MSSSPKPTVVFCAALPIACVDMFAQLAPRFDSWVVVHNWRTWGLMAERGLPTERLLLLQRLPGAPRGSYTTSPAEAWVAPFRALLTGVGAQRLVLFNHYRPPYREGAAQAACELEIPSVFVERGALSSHYYFDPLGLGPEGVLGRPDVWKALCASPLRADPQVTALTRWHELQHGEVEPQPAPSTPAALRASLDLVSGQRVAFFPMQVDDDIQITRFSPWIRDMAQGLRVLTEATRRTGWRLLVKPHPRSALADLSQQVDHVTISPQVHIGTAVEAADAVVTVNSGVGLEALTLGKTVITLGDGIYTGKGLTLEARSDAELDQALAQATAWRPPQDKLACLAAFLTEEYLLPYPLGPAAARAAAIVAEPDLAVPRLLGRVPWPRPEPFTPTWPPVDGRRTAVLLVAAREVTVARAREELHHAAPELALSEVALPRTWWRASQRTVRGRAAVATEITFHTALRRHHDLAVAIVDDTLLRPRAVRAALMACRARARYWWCPGQPALPMTWRNLFAREIGDWLVTRG